MGIACSSATFGLISAYASVKAGLAKCALVVNPEYATPQVNLKSRDSHFIFGDGATAVVIERQESCTSPHAFRIRSEEHTSELQSRENLVCRLLLEKQNLR